MKLELKHIAHYLPYGLKVLQESEVKGVTNICLFDGVKEYILIQLDNGLNHKIDGIKPILRPMSDLYKSCLEGGKIPIVELAKIALPRRRFCLRNSGCWCADMKFIYDNHTSSFRTLIESGGSFSNGDVPINQLQLFQKLFEWHFDVFGLIEQGLAIDKNTVQI